MLKLSDYLDYLHKEIIQARMQADVNSIELAKKYAEHEYLQFFKVPRFQMHNIKLDIPVKIAQINDDPEYELDITKPETVDKINEAIKNSNQRKNLQLPTFDKDLVKKDSFRPILNDLDGSIGKVILKDRRQPLSEFPAKPLKPSQDTKLTPDQLDELQKIVREVGLSERRVVSSKLKDIFIDPNTGTEADKGKILVNLHVEMVEEGIRLIRTTDKNGKVIEQISVD